MKGVGRSGSVVTAKLEDAGKQDSNNPSLRGGEKSKTLVEDSYTSEPSELVETIETVESHSSQKDDIQIQPDAPEEENDDDDDDVIPPKTDRFKSVDDFETFILKSVSEASLIDGSFPDITDTDVLTYSDVYGDKYKELSRNAMKHAYSHYEERAFGHDELTPMYLTLC